MVRRKLISISTFIFFLANTITAQVSQLDLNTNWKFTPADGEERWLSADVPGCIHTDLLNHSLIEDPFYRINEKSQQWIGEEDWIYETTFNVSNDILNRNNVELVFEGLDTYADVYLNGSLIHSANNMHRVWRLDVKELLKAKENNIRIYFHSAIKKGLELKEVAPIPFFQYPNNDQTEVRTSTLMRKAGYHFGWDWGPRLVTAGIWRNVLIEAWSNAKLEGVKIATLEVAEGEAKMVAVGEILSEADQEISMNINFGDIYVSNQTIDLKKGLNEITHEFEIENPNLWWSNGLGEQNLYNFSVIINSEDGLLGKYDTKVGIRTIEVIREDDEYGKSMFVKLNGIPVFMKGANFIPNDNFSNRVTDEKYKYILQSAVDANMNMIRVWGGGVFEKDLFYELCDEMGLLVWQDMLFACGTYPGYDSFLENVKHEVIDNVKRIRNHASLALYCGNNEVEQAYYAWDWQKMLNEDQQKIQEDYMQKLFYETIPQALSEVDGTRYYHPTSPSTWYGGDSHLMGDMHDWGVWHGKEPFETYNYDVPRFMSEYGFQSYPEMSTIKTFTVPEDLSLESEVMEAHQRCMDDELRDKGYGNRLIKHYMDLYFKEAKDFESYLYLSQLVQSKGVKMAVEAHRRNMPLCMGTLYWQLNDCWPVASWSSIDYEGRWKALHYTIREMYKEFMLSPIVEDDSIRVYVVSDRLKSVEAQLKVTLMSFEGKEYFNETYKISVEGNKSEVFFEKEKAKFLEGKDINNLILKVELIENDNILAANTTFFVPEKELNFADPEINSQVRKKDGKYEITLTTKQFAKGVFINFPNIVGFYSDNYFDMFPGQTKTILFTPLNDVQTADDRYDIISLVDTY